MGIPGNNVMLANAISGPGIVNMMETAGNNLQLAGSMSGFTGTINCPASASTAKVQILTATVALTSAATINVAAGGTFYIAYSAVSIPCALNLGGLGNSEVYGALRIESNALVSGPVTLGGNTTIGNGAAAGNGGTISGAIGDGGHGYGITKTLTPGTLVLSGTNTFTGPTTINSNTLTIGGSGCLGVTATATNYANTVSNNGVFNYNSSAAQNLVRSCFRDGRAHPKRSRRAHLKRKQFLYRRHTDHQRRHARPGRVGWFGSYGDGDQLWGRHHQ